MSERTFAPDEVNAALELAGPGELHPDPETAAELAEELAEARAIDRAAGIVEGWHRGWTHSGVESFWHDSDEKRHIVALALGVLPEGWVVHRIVRSTYMFNSREHGQEVMWVECGCNTICAKSRFWPAAVRNGHAEVACRLIAAHVELERLRARKGGEK